MDKIPENAYPRERAFLGDAFQEMHRSRQKFPFFTNAHEAYAVILEEVEEFWEEVRKKQSERDIRAMREELVQIAAMAMKAAADLREEG
jgi:glutamyl-tRNA reductase